jgi:hypothetical protein
MVVTAATGFASRFIFGNARGIRKRAVQIRLSKIESYLADDISLFSLSVVKQSVNKKKGDPAPGSVV